MPSSRQRLERGSPLLRLRLGFIIIAVVMSFFGARLVQLQGVDPGSYAEMAAEEAIVEVALPAERGDILDRNGVPLADSVEGKMLVSDPLLTKPDAPKIAKILTNRLGLNYFDTLQALRGSEPGSRFEFIARQVPASRALDAVTALENEGFTGVTTRDDPVRTYPAGDVASSMIGFIGTDEALAGFERTFDAHLAGTDGQARYQVGDGKRIPLGENTVVPAVDGKPLRTTIDRDLQWFTQRVLAQTVNNYRAKSGVALVQDTRTGEILAMADHPTYDPNKPLEASEDLYGSAAVGQVYEPGSVQKVLTAASLLDAGEASPRMRLEVPPRLERQDSPIGDWFEHGTLHMTFAGVIAQSSNIGTVLATDAFEPPELVDYLHGFGLGRRTGIAVRGESSGILTPGDQMSSQTKDRVAFGQSLSVTAVQMTAALNAVANDGVWISPSVIRGSAALDSGRLMGTDHATARRVVSQKAARQTRKMMQLVVDEEKGVAPGAQVADYLVAGKTGTAQRVDPECGCYDGSTSVSFGGFAPAEDPRFTVYVVVHDPQEPGGGGSIAGPAFSRIMGYALSRYRVPPTGAEPSRLPVSW